MLRDELDVHLTPLKRQFSLKIWYDGDIRPGVEWEKEIYTQLNSAHIILLLVSPPFMASEYCYSVEMKRSLERHKAGFAHVLPIILRPVDWEDAPFSTLQVLPKNALPVTSWPDRDLAFADIASNIRKIIRDLAAYSNIDEGEAQYKNEQFEEALKAYSRAILLDQGVVSAYAGKGNALLALKRFEEAAATYEQAIRLNPNNASLYSKRGDALLALKRFEEAAATYEQAIRLNPNDISLYSKRGDTLFTLKRFEEAAATYEQAVHLESKNNETLSLLLPLNQRIENADNELFWRHFASHVLRISLMLISNLLPDNSIGLVLPLNPNKAFPISRVEELPQVGESLCSWLSPSHSFYTFFSPAPSFQYSTDYSLYPLVTIKDERLLEPPRDKTLIVLDRVDRRSKSLSLSSAIVETIYRLLTPLYENAEILQTCFGLGMRDDIDNTSSFGNIIEADKFLNKLADMIVHLGGKISEGKERWHFCCILLPNNPSLPIQQQSLVLQAQSQHSPYEKDMTVISPMKSLHSLILRAYQSGQMIYRSQIFDTDTSIVFHNSEGPVRSAIALPIKGESETALGVMYIASYETNAFSENDQRVIRMIAYIIEEAILAYQKPSHLTSKLMKAINKPLSIDPIFEDFLSENDFVHDIEDLLTELKTHLEEWEEPKRKKDTSLDERRERFKAEEKTDEVVAFIGVDIDNQSNIAARYGNQAAKKLSKEVGQRIQGQHRLYNRGQRRLYHLYADRYYLVLKNMAIDEVRDKAEQLRKILEGNYYVEAQSTLAEHQVLPKSLFEISGVTVRLGVPFYTYGKLKELLQRYPANIAVTSVRAEIMRALDTVLDLGQQEGGNIVISWDSNQWGYIRWP